LPYGRDAENAVNMMEALQETGTYKKVGMATKKQLAERLDVHPLGNVQVVAENGCRCIH
jgi:hypothetical protein